jgi:hypothetical protein
MNAPADLLAEWLHRRLPPSGAQWFRDTLEVVRKGADDRTVAIAVGLASRRVGKADLLLSPAEREAADRIRPGWDPTDWSIDQAARLCLLLSLGDDPARLAVVLDRLSGTAELGELVAFLRGLPLYPEPHRHVARAAEGVRSNMRTAFEAVAHRNPFPAENFDEGAWNQMVLKALFIGAPLFPIQGLERRANPTLMRMLSDYAHERWAARRPVSPELWRCVGPVADEAALADLARVLETGDDAGRDAAVLALAACPLPAARDLLTREPVRARAVADGHLTWRHVART